MVCGAFYHRQHRRFVDIAAALVGTALVSAGIATALVCIATA
jgi:hypothetical protein